jgi:transcriptional regulator with XRE-family HTH domain
MRTTVDWPQRQDFMAYLEDLRKSRGYHTVLALAEAAGISHTTLSAWRNGRQRPSLQTLQDLADVLGVPAHTLAEKAGIVDPARFGQAAPTAAGTVEELSDDIKTVLDDPELSEDDRVTIAQMLLEEFDRDEQTRRQLRAERARATVETWKRARGA